MKVTKRVIRISILIVSCLAIVGCNANEKIVGAALGTGLLAALIGLASTYNQQTVSAYFNR